jgi:RNA polymerase sigma-70 factor (ECF subfamily)
MTQIAAEEEFLLRADPLRGELTAHCYRMVGSLHDAEDLVQDTYVRAWRSYDRFEGRSSVRTWMYRIATRVCLTALESRQRRPLPVGLGAPSSDPAGPLDSRPEVPWLEPLPDRVVAGDKEAASDPADVVVGRESVRLAFVAALQRLTPQQRAVLILRDVLAWRAAEVAEALDMSVAGVNSTLQRARAHLGQPSDDDAPDDVDDPELLQRYVVAFEEYDVDAIVKLLTKDAVWQMPPFTGWYQGNEAIGRLISTHCPAEGPGDMRMVATRANGQPAFGLYMRSEDGVHRPFQFHVLTISGGFVTDVTCFFDTDVFRAAGLPEALGPQN